jgi:hypothetical protein
MDKEAANLKIVFSKISLRLAASFNIVENNVQMTEFPCNFIWKKDSEESYKKAFQSDLIKDKIKNLCIDKGVVSLCHIMFYLHSPSHLY